MAEDDVKVHYDWESEDIEDSEIAVDKAVIKEKSSNKKAAKKSKKKTTPLKKKEAKEETAQTTSDTNLVGKEEIKEEAKPEKVEKEAPVVAAEEMDKPGEVVEEEKLQQPAEEKEKEDIIIEEEKKEVKLEQRPEDKPKEDVYEQKPEEKPFTPESSTFAGGEQQYGEEEPKPNYMIAFVAVVVIIILSIFILKTKDIFPSSGNDNVVAMVNGEIITLEELESVYKATVPVEYSAFITKEDFLNQSLVPEKVLLQEAGKKGIKVSELELQDGLKKFLMENTMTEEQLKSRLESDGVDFESFRVNFKTRLIITKLLDEEVVSQIKINDFEIIDYYESNSDKFVAKPGQIRARHILVDSKDLAEELLEEINNGEDFEELAKENSIGPSAPFGGELGFFGEGMMVEEFEDVAFGLEAGEVSDIVETNFGYHIIKREENEMTLEEAKEKIRTTLQTSKQSAAVEVYINKLVSNADVVFKLDKAPEATGFTPAETTSKRTFVDTGDEVYKIDGKPVIRLYTTTWCPHCVWVKDTFDKVAREYIAQGKIVAYHWDVDSGDNTLTPEIETNIPPEEIEIFKKYNSKGSIPTFVFGNKYKRIGNGYEAEDDLGAEEAEFRAIIEELIAE
ncbi:MAG: peptidylprolyl isomerase [Candidatus Woesearchaeota archaeon]|nr:peptidylprolyl isomerase [Candidatus Woesearchaeota archaeon]